MGTIDLIRRFNMQKHPEVGYYAVTYEAADKVDGRHISTAIYFLITKDDFSAFHRIDADEIWHFYGGDPLDVVEIDTAGKLIVTKVDSMNPQYVVKKGHWFGSRVVEGGEFSLVGCTVSPGFMFEGFELAKANELGQSYPEHSKIIAELTRQ